MDVIKRIREEIQDAREQADKISADRDAILEKADALLAKADTLNRGLHDHEEVEFNACMKTADELGERIQALVDEERRLTDSFVGIYNGQNGGDYLTQMSAWRQRYCDAKGITLKKDQRTMASVNLRHTELKAFPNNDEGRQQAYDCGQWFRALYARSKGHHDEQAEAYARNRFGNIYATATEGDGAGGGYTVPSPLSSAYIQFQKEIGITRRIADYRPMSADTLSIPKLTAGPTVRYVSEAAEITASDQTWGQLSCTATKRAILSKVSRELADDNIIGLMDQIVQRFAYEIALVMDDEAVNGDGTGTYGGETGLLSSIGAGAVYSAGGSSSSGVDTWPELTLSDFTSTMGLLPSEHSSNPKWVCSRAFYHTVMLKLSAAAGGSSLMDMVDGAGRTRPAFLGYEVLMSDKMPMSTGTGQKSCLFGTFSDSLILAERTPLEIAISTDAYFAEDLIGVRGTTRYDLLCHTAGSANTVGGYVALATSST